MRISTIGDSVKKYQLYIYLLLFALFVVGAYVYDNYSNSYKKRFTPNVRELQKTYIKKQAKLYQLLELFNQSVIYKANGYVFIKNTPFFYNLYNSDGFVLAIYRNDSLKYVSHNAVPLPNITSLDLFSSKILQLSNGWYGHVSAFKNNYQIVGLFLIKHKYKYQNEYLTNDFHQDFNIESYYNIKLTKGIHNVFDNEGNFLFALEPNWDNPVTQDRQTSIVSIILILSALFFLLLSLIQIKNVIAQKINSLIAAAVFSVVLSLIIIILLRFQIPAFIFETPLFNPQYFAMSDILSSLGNLLIYVFLSLIIIYFLVLRIHFSPNIKHWNKYFRYFTFLCCILSIFLLNELLHILFKGLILNSNISLSTNDLFQLSGLSYIGFLIIGLMLLSYFLLLTKISELMLFLLPIFKHFLSSFIIIFFLYSVIRIYLFPTDALYLLLPIVPLLLIAYLKRHNRVYLKLNTLLMLLIIFTLFTTIALYQFNDEKEKNRRIALAIKLAAEQDPLGEYLFQDIAKNLLNDNNIITAIKQPIIDENRVTKIIQNYFTDYWAKYDIQITICKTDEIITILPNNITTNCNLFFSDLIKNQGKPTITNGLYFLNNYSGLNSYIARLTYFGKKGDGFYPINIYIELDSKFIPKELGYPELLIDKELKLNKNLINYSYVKYKNKELLTQFGDFYYSINPDVYGNFKDEFTFFEREEYSHLFYKIDDSSAIIVSKKSFSWLEIIAPFSYLFVFYLTCILTILLIFRFPLLKRNIKLNFKNRVQVSMITIVIITFILIGSGTIFYIVNLYNKKNFDTISEKTHSILVEVENKLANEEILTAEMKDYIRDVLLKLSRTFFTDINLFDQNGKLLASSRQKIFDEELVSNHMNPVALYQMQNFQTTLFEHKEKIGNMEYISAYVPFRNNQNRLIAYLNVPYFAKQSQLKKEISSFVMNFINIYVILIGLTVIIALIISNYITKPLRIIKEKLGQFKLDKANEKLVWKNKDEIGALVNEYNRMIDELAKSAELLAKSERESAWREMAKQVAHEIKNPLTPMKLSVQYLQKAWHDKADNWDERLERFSKTIIEQIDSLSVIATEFSDFAKMPQSLPELIEINELISKTIDLYKDFDSVQIQFEQQTSELFVLADRKQLLRVFNNLLNNAIQAKDKERTCVITIKAIEKQDKIIIYFNDNGIGIAKDKQDKIFSPNFTTKSGGMGLGLAMVKSIIEHFGGSIDFYSEENVGTQFIIELPKAHNN